MEAATKSPRNQTISASAEQLISSLLGNNFRPSDDDPLPPGPWDPLVRNIFDFEKVFGPVPDPWFVGMDAVRLGDRVSLNPQPLPPRATMVATLAQAAIARAELIDDVAGNSDQSERGASYMLDLIDDWCGTPPRRLPWPKKWPRPNWANEGLGALDHLIMASTINQALASGIGGSLAEALKSGHDQLVETATKTMPG